MKRRYAFAVVAVLAATLIRLAFPAIMVERAPFFPFFIAVLLTAVLGGRGPGLLAVALSCLESVIALAMPYRLDRASIPAQIFGIVQFGIANIAVVVVIDALQRATLRADEASRMSAAVLESTSDAFVRVDRSWKILYINHAAEELGKTPRAQVLGHDIRDLYPNATRLTHELEKAMKTERNVRTEYFEPSLRVWVEVSVYPTADGLCGFLRDITERKRAEEERARYVQEIEALNQRLQRAMGETHHRIKNSLQVITALIDLQSQQSGSAVPKEELRRLINHVQGLAAIHDLLTNQTKESPLSDDVSVSAALGRLVPLIQSMLVDRAIVLRADEARLPLRLATGLSVLINELVSNAIKHGRGPVQLTFAATDTTGRLEVCDDGPGFPPDFDPERGGSTGIELITSLAHWDLAGTITFGNRPDGGARVVVEFPLGSAIEHSHWPPNNGGPLPASDPDAATPNGVDRQTSITVAEEHAAETP